jgi:predicted enzyme related to lactoylglutathione lyase
MMAVERIISWVGWVLLDLQKGLPMAFELYRVILPVKDIEEAVRFYSRVLRIGGERVSPGRHYFACGGTILACYDPVADGDPIGKGWLQHASQYIYFATNELEAALESVRDAGGKIAASIETKPWGERMFYATDPFGNPISFVDERTVFRGSGATNGQ